MTFTYSELFLPYYDNTGNPYILVLQRGRQRIRTEYIINVASGYQDASDIVTVTDLETCSSHGSPCVSLNAPESESDSQLTSKACHTPNERMDKTKIDLF